MPKPIILLILLFCHFHLSAQVPDYFSNNPVWRVNCETWDGMNADQINWQFFIDGDTLMDDGQLYHVMRSVAVQTNFAGEPDPSTFSTNDYPTFLRQEGKLIYRYGEALPFHNFDLAIGDTLTETAQYYPEEDYEIVVIGKDSIESESGWLNLFTLDNPYDNEGYILEGVGHHHGFFGPPHVIVNGVCHLICYRQNDSVVFEGEDAAPCDIVSSLEEFKPLSFDIIPNPTSGELTINLHDQESSTYREVLIKNIDGRLVGVEALSASNRIDLSNYPDGVYVLSILVDNERYINKLVVKGG